jgi:hypothetical protein
LSIPTLCYAYTFELSITKQSISMSTIIAYAVSIFLNLGVISAADVNSSSSNLRVIEREGKTVVQDAVTGAEVIIYM